MSSQFLIVKRFFELHATTGLGPAKMFVDFKLVFLVAFAL